MFIVCIILRKHLRLLDWFAVFAGAKNLLFRSKAVLLFLGFTVFLAGCHGTMRKRRLRSQLHPL